MGGSNFSPNSRFGYMARLIYFFLSAISSQLLYNSYRIFNLYFYQINAIDQKFFFPSALSEIGNLQCIFKQKNGAIIRSVFLLLLNIQDFFSDNNLAFYAGERLSFF